MFKKIGSYNSLGTNVSNSYQGNKNFGDWPKCTSTEHEKTARGGSAKIPAAGAEVDIDHSKTWSKESTCTPPAQSNNSYSNPYDIFLKNLIT